MKRILYYFIIASALFLTSKASALDATPTLSVPTTQQVTTIHYCPSSNHNLFFEDILADITDDDDSKESEKKKNSLEKKGYSTAPINTQNLSKNVFNSLFLTHFFFPRRTPLFVFLCVFRI